MSTTKKLHPAFYVAFATFMLEFICYGNIMNSSGMYYNTVTEALGVSYGTFTMYSTILFIVQAIFVPIAAKLVEKMKLRVLLPACIVIMCVSSMCMGFFTSVYQFYIAGVIMGMSSCVLFWIAPFAIMNRYFKKGVGIAIAIVMCGTTLGGAVFTPIVSHFISMDSFLFFDEGWRASYFIMGIIAIVGSLPFMLFVANRPEDKGLLRYGETEEDLAKGDEQPVGVVTGVSRSVALKSPAFWMLMVSICIAYLAGAIYMFIPSFVESIEIPAIAAMAATVTSTSMIAAVIGKLGFGTLNDKIGSVKTMLIGFVAGLGTLLMYFFPSSSAIIMAGGFLYGIYYAFPVVFHPLLCRNIFGARDYEKIYSYLATASAYVNAFGVSLWGFSIDITGDYGFIMICGGACAIISLITGIIAFNSGKKLEHTAA